jgi:hypothetical protein
MEEFVPWMKAKGFSYRKTGHKFTLENACARYQFNVGFDGRGGLVSTDASMFVDFPKLGKLYEHATGQMGGICKGGGLLQLGAQPWQYDIFTQPYDGMTPVEKKGISTLLIHPQERVDGAITFLADAYEQVAQPLFQQFQTYRQLADHVMVQLRSVPVPLSFMNLPAEAGHVFLLQLYLGDDTTELIDLTRKNCPPYRAAEFEAMAVKLRDFAATADPATFDL